MPAVGGLEEKWRLEAAVWRLAADMRLARQVAITEGKSTRMEFRWEARDYRLLLPAEKKTVKLPPGISYAMNNFPLNGGVRGFTISPLGAPSPAGTVGFKNERGGKLYVIITPATGRVRVSRTPPT
ncbi:MAG TPA: GspH/FimT family protein [Bacillota bacterium]|nr:GspH/FimT family protein [Bacillota bacterium]